MIHAVKHEEDNQIFCMDYNTNFSLLAYAGKDKFMRVMDELTKTVVHKFRENGK